MQDKKKPVTGSRRRILEAALDEFSEYGLAGARVDRIAERAKINKAMLYYHFTSKEKLYQEVIEDYLKKNIEYFVVQAGEADDLEAMLLSLSQAHHEFIHPNTKFNRIAIREYVSGSKWMRNAVARIISGRGLPGKMKRLLDQGKREGRFREVDSRQALVAFIGMNLFYLLMSPLMNTIWEIKNEEKFKEGRPEVIVDLFLHGLEKK